MALKLIQPGETEAEAEGRRWLREAASDAVITCHGQGHLFPRLRADNKSLPGVVPVRQHDGGWQLRQPCPSGCGVVRTITTLPGGIIDRSCDYDYEYPADGPDGYHPPKGANLRPRDYLEETSRRMQGILMREAEREAARG